MEKAEQNRIAVFFDVDETVIKGASSWIFTRELYRRGFFGVSDLLFAARHATLYLLLGEDQERIDKIKNRALAVMAGRRQEEVEEIAREVGMFLKEQKIFPGTQRIIQRHLEAGHDIWLISAAPQVMPENLAHELGLTGGIGTKIQMENGVYLPALESGLMHGQGKKDAVVALAKEHGYDLDHCFAYSDSLNDLPLLSVVGHPNAINPDIRLQYWANARGWPVYDFRRRTRWRSIWPRKRKTRRIMKKLPPVTSDHTPDGN